MPAGYRRYAGSPADFIGQGVAGGPLLLKSGTVTVWTAISGGTRITDLLDASEDAATAIAADDFGNFTFFAPENLGDLWVTAGTTSRYVVHPADVGDRIKALEAALAGAVAAAENATAAVATLTEALAAQQVEYRALLLEETNQRQAFDSRCVTGGDGIGFPFFMRRVSQDHPTTATAPNLRNPSLEARLP